MTKAQRAAKIYLPAAAQSGNYEGRGMWYDSFQCGGRDKSGTVIMVGANIGYIADFCGGRAVGCVNPYTAGWRDSFAGTGLEKELPDVPTEVLAIWRKHVGTGLDEYVWPGVGLFAHLVGTVMPITGAAQMFAWDRVSGMTTRILSAGAAILSGISIGSEAHRGVATLRSWKRAAPYVNLNSGYKVAQLTFKFSRQRSSPLLVQSILRSSRAIERQAPIHSGIYNPY